MRVDDLNLNGAAASGTGRTQNSQPIERDGRSNAAARNGSTSDSVELSGLSRTLNASADARSAHVDQLAAAYQGGRYQADPYQTGQNMIGDALQSSAAKLP